MAVATPDSTTETFVLEDAEFDIACDISGLRVRSGYPPCKGDPARWVAWRPNCCAAGPRYRLICDYCKTVYQNWIAKQAYIVCNSCGRENGGYHTFTPLKGKS